MTHQQRSGQWLVRIVPLFLFGLFYRLLIASLFPQPRIWDQDQYYGFALGMLREGLHGDTVRLYGYPIFIVPFIVFFGLDFQWPLTIFQALLDSTSALLVYGLAKKIFPVFTSAAATTAYALYLVNPFSSAYTGVVLTEVVGIFFITATFWIFLSLLESWSMKKMGLASFLLGYIPQIRPSFGYLAYIALGYLFLKGRYTWNTWWKGVVLLVIFLLPYGYNIAVNIVKYKQFAWQSVDNVFIREVYISLFIDRAAVPGNVTFQWPSEVYMAWWDFSSPTTPEARHQINEKYKYLALQRIQSDPLRFVLSRLAKGWYVWEKRYMFPYTPQPGGQTASAVLYYANIMLLSMAAYGYALWFTSRYVQSKTTLKIFGTAALLLTFYITVAHMFSTSEERFSLPAYPMICMFAGYAFISFINNIRHTIKRS